MIDTVQHFLILVLIGIGLLDLYHSWQTQGPLTGTLSQRLKCVIGRHDYRLLAFTTDPWRIIWRCHWCQHEHLTPDTHAKRVELDRQMPFRPATGKTVRL